MNYSVIVNNKNSILKKLNNNIIQKLIVLNKNSISPCNFNRHMSLKHTVAFKICLSIMPEKKFDRLFQFIPSHQEILDLQTYVM